MTTKSYIPTIGLEIHAELKTTSKMFCSCRNNPDEDTPNKNICSVCMGHPGTLPVLNYEAIKKVLRLGLSVNGTIADFTEWDRKNYFYPDIPKGYQISQYLYPLISGGELAGVAIERIHLEEDTAQSTHDHDLESEVSPPRGGLRGLTSLVNFNRAGVPLMELVTKPVIHDATTAVRFAKELQLILRYLGAGDANLEKGEMRVEANISVAPAFRGETSAQVTSRSPLGMPLGTKTEIKNLNSFRSVERAIAYEIERQTSLLNDGGKVVQETRGWDENKNETYSQRSKEGSHDYRYFPEPDIPKLKISEIPDFSIEKLSADMPELPAQLRTRYSTDFSMTEKEIAIFVESPELVHYFESIISRYKIDPVKVKLTVNYLLSDYLGLLKNAPDVRLETIKPEAFAELIAMISDSSLSSRGAKDLLAILLKESTSGESPRQLAEKHSLIQKSDIGTIEPIIDKVLADNQPAVSEYKAGKLASLQFLIGQTMKATKGSANPTVIKELLLKKIN